jgi:two-component system, NtrC family, response regulator PilR
MGKGVLFVSPKREDATILSRMLGALSVPIEYVADLANARAKILNGRYPVVLTEANLSDGTWLDVLELAHRATPRSEVIVTHAVADARFWAEVLNMGAYDLIAQPFATGEVQRILSNACTHASTSVPRSATAAL